MKTFQAGSGYFFLIKVCSKIFMQGPVDPDQRFKRDQDRDENFSSRV